MPGSDSEPAHSRAAGKASVPAKSATTAPPASHLCRVSPGHHQRPSRREAGADKSGLITVWTMDDNRRSTSAIDCRRSSSSFFRQPRIRSASGGGTAGLISSIGRGSLRTTCSRIADEFDPWNGRWPLAIS